MDMFQYYIIAISGKILLKTNNHNEAETFFEANKHDIKGVSIRVWPTRVPEMSAV